MDADLDLVLDRLLDRERDREYLGERLRDRLLLLLRLRVRLLLLDRDLVLRSRLLFPGSLLFILGKYFGNFKFLSVRAISTSSLDFSTTENYLD